VRPSGKASQLDERSIFNEKVGQFSMRINKMNIRNGHWCFNRGAFVKHDILPPPNCLSSYGGGFLLGTVLTWIRHKHSALPGKQPHEANE
jgi:hypothetical protein